MIRRLGGPGMHGIGGMPLANIDARCPSGNPWWDPDGSIGCCVGAYQAKGAASYVTSLVNLVNPGVNDLTEGNGAVAWAAGTGWAFNAAASQYLITGLIPANTQAWSIIIQYAGITTVGGPYLTGAYSGPARVFGLRARLATNQVSYLNGNNILVAPELVTGNLCVAGNAGYRNGAVEGGAIGAWGGASTEDVYIGCLNSGGVAAAFVSGNIYAEALYSCTLTAPQVALVAAAMAAL